VTQLLFAPGKWLTVATQATFSDPTGEPSALLLIEPQATYNSTVTEMLHRIELTVDKAIETSAELWPNRTRASRDAAAYFQWHQKVCPAGMAHLSGGPVSQNSDLYIRAKSITGLAEGLVSMLDHFHRRSAGVPGAVVGIAEGPEGVHWSPIASLDGFFKSPRGYIV
jgi:hypothetical protein